MIARQKRVREILGNERGAVLVVGLIILVVLTLLGITVLQTTVIEEKMANNMNQRQLAFQAAEAALREVEFKLRQGTIPPSAFQAETDPPHWTFAKWWEKSGSQAASALGELPPPRYVVEKLLETADGIASFDLYNPTPTQAVFRITVRAEGMVPGAEVVLQSVYRQ